MTRTKSKGRARPVTRRRSASRRPSNKAKETPEKAPEMEEFEEGVYPREASRMHSAEDASLESGGGRAATRADELSRRGPTA